MAAAAGASYPDTSFLISLYGEDVFSGRARGAVIAGQSVLLICELSVLEYENALRLLRFRKLIAPRELTQRLSAFRQDREAGLLRFCALDWPTVWRQANTLSEQDTTKGGHRMADILHVAAASHLGTKLFLSFDDRQRLLAKQQGFALNL